MKERNKDKVYIGKPDPNKNGALQICKVLECCISTGDAIVFNRSTKKIETVKFTEKRKLDKNIIHLALDTPELDCGH